MSLQPEQEIIRSIRDGESSAYQQVFDTCYESLCQYAYTLLRDDQEAEDTVQSMFVKLWERRSSLDIKQNIRSYLFRSVYNQCMNQIEHRAVIRKHSEHLAATLAQVTEPDPFPEELETKIRLIVNSLPPQCRTIFMMSRYDEMKYSEIAIKLNISVNTIQNQICKALRILREELKDIII